MSDNRLMLYVKQIEFNSLFIMLSIYSFTLCQQNLMSEIAKSFRPNICFFINNRVFYLNYEPKQRELLLICLMIFLPKKNRSHESD